MYCSAPYNTTATSPVWFGPPKLSNALVNGSPASNYGNTYVPSGYASLGASFGGTTGGTITWTQTHGSGTLTPSGTYANIVFSGFSRVVVTTSNGCGSGQSWTYYLSTESGYYGYRIGPNPAKDQLSVLMETKEMAGELIEGIELYNEATKLCASIGSDKLAAGRYDKKTIDLDVKALPRGKYFLHVKMKDKILEKHQVILD